MPDPQHAPGEVSDSYFERLPAIIARTICEGEGKRWLALDNKNEDVWRWWAAGHAGAAAARARAAQEPETNGG